MKNLHLVIVTFNRLNLLKVTLPELIDNVADCVDCIHLINNNSTDGTKEFVELLAAKNQVLIVHNLPKNIGGAGGFEFGMRVAYDTGAEWIGLMDDDVRLAEDCLTALKRYSSAYDALIAVREDINGNLQEFAAVEYNLRNPFFLNPNRCNVNRRYGIRANCPDVFPVESAAFEGFFVSRKVVEKIGFPNPDFFIYSDDFDYCIRLKRAGFEIGAVRDARLTRLLPYRSAKFDSWKSYYIWRNFFVIHFTYGENVFVRMKPFAISVVLWFRNFFVKEKIDVFRIISDARTISKNQKANCRRN